MVITIVGMDSVPSAVISRNPKIQLLRDIPSIVPASIPITPTNILSNTMERKTPVLDKPRILAIVMSRLEFWRETIELVKSATAIAIVSTDRLIIVKPFHPPPDRGLRMAIFSFSRLSTMFTPPSEKSWIDVGQWKEYEKTAIEFDK